MEDLLFVANFPPATTGEQIRALFAEQGGVRSVEMGVDEKTGKPYALVTMDTEKAATQALRALNGHRLEDLYLAVSYAGVYADRKIMNRERKAVEAVIAALGEKDKVPVRRLTTMGLLCGSAFMEALLKETEEVEAKGGIMTSDGSRRRTKGGVFFYLARHRVSPPVRRIIYNRKGKIPQPGEETAEEPVPDTE